MPMPPLLSATFTPSFCSTLHRPHPVTNSPSPSLPPPKSSPNAEVRSEFGGTIINISN
ncbi:hypothetical protein Sjap_013968 [Stephania japonica]|uniref:Uncharacterized protein n=1 Tax=Stephania japonica TaxID=461633 RepID=A0AAP0J1G4_9MAGN